MGTRLERGIPPMYQVGDRHCEKLAEMMNSPTWRSQNSGPHLVRPAMMSGASVTSSRSQGLGTNHSDEAIYDDQGSDEELRNDRSSTHPASSPSSGTTFVNELQLARFGESIRLIGLDPFLKSPEGTFVLSAAASRGRDTPQEALYGEMRRVQVSQRYTSAQSEAEESDEAFAGEREENTLNSCGDDRLVTLHTDRPLTDICNGIKATNGNPNDDNEEPIGHNEATKSIKTNLWPGDRHVRAASPDEKQRFGGLIQRLRQQTPAQVSSDHPPLGDPANTAFAPKVEDSSNIAKRSEHVRSDSGYASPSVSSRPSTGPFRRPGRESSGSTGAECFKVQHFRRESNDAALESSCQNSMLNPTAKEFSSAGGKGGSPSKPSLLTRPPIDSNLWIPPQHHSGFAVPSPPSRPNPALYTVQSSWQPVQTNTSTPLMDFGPLQPGLSPPFPGVIPQMGEFMGGVMPPLPGLGIAGPVPQVAPFTSLSPGSYQPCSHGPMLAPCHHGPFHQQLPNLMTCNNPTHQGLSPFASPAINPSLPATVMAQASAAGLPGHVAGQPVPGSAPLLKHVPKPKVPNTTGQQNWELVHELRRMHEPGYAQKCKEKQRKRYQKQIDKTGGPGA